MSGYNAECHVWHKPNTAFQHKHLIPTVKHCGGEVKIWACFAVKYSRCCTGPVNFCAKNFKELCINECLKPQLTEATL